MYRLLIVDDEIYEREGLSKQLSWEQYGIEQVDVAENGMVALSCFFVKPYDIVISDVKMPVMDGLTMALEMRRYSPDVKLLFLSGYDDFVFVKQAIQLKAYDYLLKPVEKSELERKITEITNELQEEQERRLQDQVRCEETIQQQSVLEEIALGYFRQEE